ncbi:hypothetical protein PEL8287_03924 [Roseovarius litorisediminis]|uniref:Uncharacterized protein n=1 Tax=Roseovarius litorisediminis TaxID=1312363 RepID=A0A1Y5TUT7_9RHOB|nr:hypothetical protein [Roseovarius litorisediminis]SLN70693.1 hypothetical protein PEL8287_03924 [Roseovarius litorisediminis]
MKRLGLLLFVVATPAHAYIGPGAGLGAIGTVIAVLAAVVLLVAGFVWYPVKRLLKKRSTQDDKKQ